MDRLNPRSRLARLLRPEASLPLDVPLLPEDYSLAPEITDPAAIDLIITTHNLMKEYSDALDTAALNRPETNRAYLEKYVDVLFEATETLEEPSNIHQTMIIAQFLMICKFLGTGTAPSNAPLMVNWVFETLNEEDHDLQKSFDDAVKAAGHQLPNSSQFWKYISRQLLIGNLDSAEAALSSGIHETWDDLDSTHQQAILVVASFLKSYPKPNAAPDAFRAWRREVLAFRSSLNELSVEGWRTALTQVTSVLVGKAEAVVKVAESWETVVSGLFLFSDPAPERLHEYYDMATKGQLKVDMSIDYQEGCAMLVEDNILRALSVVERLDVLAAVVFSEFIHNQDPEALRKRAPLSLREFYGIQYALSLLGTPKLVSFGLEVFQRMGSPVSRNILTTVLPLLAATSSLGSSSALQLAQDLGMDETLRILHREAAARELADENYVAGFEELFESNDLLQLRERIWELFERFLVAGRPLGSADTLDVLRSQQVGDLGLPEALAAFIAPLAVLTIMLDHLAAAAEHNDVQAADIAVAAAQQLLGYPNLPPRYFPLIVGQVADLPITEMETKTVAQMMTALDSWETSESPVEGLKLLDRARSESWGTNIDPGYTSEEVLWMLRRRLAGDVYV